MTHLGQMRARERNHGRGGCRRRRIGDDDINAVWGMRHRPAVSGATLRANLNDREIHQSGELVPGTEYVGRLTPQND